MTFFNRLLPNPLPLPTPLPPPTPLPSPLDLPCIAPSAEGDSIDYFTNVLRQRQLNVGENLAEYIMGEWGMAGVLQRRYCNAAMEKSRVSAWYS